MPDPCMPLQPQQPSHGFSKRPMLVRRTLMRVVPDDASDPLTSRTEAEAAQAQPEDLQDPVAADQLQGPGDVGPSAGPEEGTVVFCGRGYIRIEQSLGMVDQVALKEVTFIPTARSEDEQGDIFANIVDACELSNELSALLGRIKEVSQAALAYEDDGDDDALEASLLHLLLMLVEASDRCQALTSCLDNIHSFTSRDALLPIQEHKPVSPAEVARAMVNELASMACAAAEVNNELEEFRQGVVNDVASLRRNLH